MKVLIVRDSERDMKFYLWLLSRIAHKQEGCAAQTTPDVAAAGSLFLPGMPYMVLCQPFNGLANKDAISHWTSGSFHIAWFHHSFTKTFAHPLDFLNHHTRCPALPSFSSIPQPHPSCGRSMCTCRLDWCVLQYCLACFEEVLSTGAVAFADLSAFKVSYNH